MLPIFQNAAFSVMSLTTALNNVPYIPGLVGRLGLFDPRPLTTTATLIEVRGERLALVPERPRGAPPTPDVEDRRAVVPVGVPHFPVRTTVYADEVQNARAFGTNDQLEAVQNVVDRREANMGRRLDLTLEYLRLGSVKGVITTEADRVSGAPMTQVSLFELFHVDPQPVIEWPIIGAGAVGRDAAAWQGQLTALVNALGRLMANSITGGMYQRIHGICGSVFYDAFAMHPERYMSAVHGGVDAMSLVRNQLGTRQEFRDVTIEEYRGVVGNIKFVADDECHFFPVGVPELFLELYAPADYMETVNTLALPRYSKMKEIDFDKGVELEAQMNTLPLCTAPRALFTVKATAFPVPPAPPAENGEPLARRR